MGITGRQPKSSKERWRKRCLPRLLAYGVLPPPYSGPSVFFAYLVNGLHASGEWDVQVTNVAIKGWQPGQFTPKRMLQTFQTLLSVLARLPRADLFYMTIGQSPAAFTRDAVLIWAASLLRKRIVVRNEGGAFHTLYEGRDRIFRWFVRLTVHKVDRVQVISETIKQQCSIIPGLAERMEVIVDGIDPPAHVTPKKLPTKGPIRILFLSNLIFEKGYADLLEAARLLRDRYPSIQFWLDFAGQFLLDKDYFRSVEEAQRDFWSRVNESGLSNIVEYHGVVVGQEKDRLLRESHLFVLPTYYRFEGSPRTVREAFSFAIPVIATNWAGLPEMISDGENGVLVPPRQPDALAQAIAKVTTDAELYASLSQGAYVRSCNGFSQQAHVAQVNRSFKTALLGQK